MPETPSFEALLDQIEAHLVAREIQAGSSLLDSVLSQDSFGPVLPEHKISFLFYLAQWVDLGYKSALTLESLLEGISASDRRSVTMIHFLRLRMVEAFICLRKQNFQQAVFLLKSSIEPGQDVLSAYDAFVAHFWIGRALRLAGDFNEALVYIGKASAIATTIHANKLVAITRIHESWLVFHKGELDRALQLLDLAEAELLPTGHALSLANISAARGRFIRSSGRYAEALKHFIRAIEIYSVDHLDHPNLARAYVNAAYVKRLMALELQPNARGGIASATTHKLSLSIAREALELLGEASGIYMHQDHQGGTGAVLVNTGYLHLESGDIENAALPALDAYKLGEEKADTVLMARASILQASVELALCEEQLEVDAEPENHALLAASYADRAILLAGQTQNRRLLAAAYIVRGLIAADESYLDWTLARSCAQRAAGVLGEHDRDHLFRELRSLDLRISRSAAVHETVRAWCEGELGGKSFQQIQDDFAEIVIPKVWLRLDKKVSRVAQELSISPKKVRRILRSARHIKAE